MLRRVGNPLNRRVSMDKFVRLVRILDRWIPTDLGADGQPQKTAIIPVTSLRGFKGYRVRGVTHSHTWTVDLFGGNFYLVKVDGYEATSLNLPLHVVNHLRRCLQLRHER